MKEDDRKKLIEAINVLKSNSQLNALMKQFIKDCNDEYVSRSPLNLLEDVHRFVLKLEVPLIQQSAMRFFIIQIQTFKTTQSVKNDFLPLLSVFAVERKSNSPLQSKPISPRNKSPKSQINQLKLKSKPTPKIKFRDTDENQEVRTNTDSHLKLKKLFELYNETGRKLKLSCLGTSSMFKKIKTFLQENNIQSIENVNEVISELMQMNLVQFQDALFQKTFLKICADLVLQGWEVALQEGKWFPALKNGSQVLDAI